MHEPNNITALNQDLIGNRKLMKFGSFVYDSNTDPSDNLAICIRHFHGNEEHTKKLFTDSIFGDYFLLHQNEVRQAVNTLLLDPTLHLIVENWIKDKRNITPGGFDRIHSFENEKLVDADLRFREMSIGEIFPQIQERVSRKEFDLDGAPNEEIHFAMDLMNGSFRQAAMLCMNGQNNRVHGLEPTELEMRPERFDFLDWSGQGFENFHKEHEEMRCKNLIALIRECRKCVIVMGASHTKSGCSTEVVKHVQYFEDLFEKNLPTTRLLVFEPCSLQKVIERERSIRSEE
jgi:hypothetical protein